MLKLTHRVEQRMSCSKRESGEMAFYYHGVEVRELRVFGVMIWRSERIV